MIRKLFPLKYRLSHVVGTTAVCVRKLHALLNHVASIINNQTKHASGWREWRTVSGLLCQDSECPPVPGESAGCEPDSPVDSAELTILMADAAYMPRV